jgi:hypothetical protein
MLLGSGQRFYLCACHTLCVGAKRLECQGCHGAVRLFAVLVTTVIAAGVIALGLATHAIGASAPGTTPTATDSPTVSEATPAASPSPTQADLAAYPCPQSSVPPTPVTPYPLHDNNNAICIPNVPQSVTDRIRADLTLRPTTDARVPEAQAQSVADPVAATGWPGFQNQLKLQGYALATAGANGPLDWFFVYYSATPIMANGPGDGHYVIVAVHADTGELDGSFVYLESGS